MLVKQQITRKHDIFILFCIGFCGLYFLRNLLGIGISYDVIYFMAVLGVLFCPKEDSIAFILSMLVFQNAGYNGKFAILILFAVIIKFYNMIHRMRTPFMLLALMCIYEFLHYFYPGGASIGEYVTYIALVLALGILCQYPYERIDKLVILKSYFGFSLFFAIMTLLQMLVRYGSFELLLQFGFRGKEYTELVNNATNLIANQNYLTVICSVNLGVGALIISQVRNKLKYMIGVSCFVFIGLLTISKMFIVILIGYAVYLVYVAFKKKVRYGITTVMLCCAAFGMIFYLFGNNLLVLVGERFEMGDFTTGRGDIIKQLFGYMEANKYVNIWGTGIINLPYCLGVAVHSSVFEVIGGWGYFGILLVVAFVVKMLSVVKKSCNTARIKIGLNLLPLVIMLSYSLTGMLFSSPGAIARLIVCIYAVGVVGDRDEI